MNLSESLYIRPIASSDNEQMAQLIREVLQEFDADKPGFASQDPEMRDLAGAYSVDGRAYWVLDSVDGILGGVGIAPVEPAVPGVCELRKMYLSSNLRGRGLGRKLLQQALSFAGQHYRWCYLETLDRMQQALKLYRQAGFIALPTPLVDTGHHGCDQWFLLEMNTQTSAACSD